MSSNETQQTTVFDVSRNARAPRQFLRLLRGLDFKKIRVEYTRGGSVRIEKLPRHTPFNGEPEKEHNRGRIANDSVYG